MSLARREPVVLFSGVIAAALVALTALGLNLPEGTEAAVQGAVVAVAGVAAAWKVRKPGQPTVIVGGLVAAVFVLLAAFGLDVGDQTQATIQGAVALVVSWIVRGQVEAEDAG